jgi:gas vesicle protein
MITQNILIGIFIGVIIGAVVAMTAFVRHCKNTPTTDED